MAVLIQDFSTYHWVADVDVQWDTIIVPGKCTEGVVKSKDKLSQEARKIDTLLLNILVCS